MSETQAIPKTLNLGLQNHINFDTMCRLYFQIEKGKGLEIDGSKGVCDNYKEEQQDFPPFGPD